MTQVCKLPSSEYEHTKDLPGIANYSDYLKKRISVVPEELNVEVGKESPQGPI